MADKPKFKLSGDFPKGEKQADAMSVEDLAKWIFIIERDEGRDPPQHVVELVGGKEEFETFKAGVKLRKKAMKKAFKNKKGRDYEVADGEAELLKEQNKPSKKPDNPSPRADWSKRTGVEVIKPGKLPKGAWQ